MADGRHIENRLFGYISTMYRLINTNLVGRSTITLRHRSRDQNTKFRIFKMADGRHFENGFINMSEIWWADANSAVRSVTLNLANKFSQCTFSVAEHYDLCRGLIIRQAWWRRSYDKIPHRPHRTDRETAAGKTQRYHTDLKLIYMRHIMPYATSRLFRVDSHFKSVRNLGHRPYKTASPTR